jgi:XTP/dITP diphosphohydrolase
MATDSGLRLELLKASDFPGIGRIEENGSSYEENSALKAGIWADFAGIPAIADDSGLEVRSLNWGPGIFSARAVPGIDEDRLRWLLERMKDHKDRRARFVACIVIAFPGGKKSGASYFSSQGACWGSIVRAPSGNYGFGYDPVFVPVGYNATFAELGRELKMEISHRAVALRGVAKMMRSVVKYSTMYCE